MDLESKQTTIIKLLDSGQSHEAIMIMLGRQAKPQGSLNRKEAISEYTKAVNGKILRNPPAQ
ncbi:Hypothetical protein FKW44_008369 [Caligus rogercresseyi]|uniref:Uncharacterized protein n=1 Tax=Caligus rogercresseyi TaxID=217165 RepID=A0A7T8KG67_CALRO|nr:Hypothetical protein FKW44_008369 [Caligus rogercresseyi]